MLSRVNADSRGHHAVGLGKHSRRVRRGREAAADLREIGLGHPTGVRAALSDIHRHLVLSQLGHQIA
jgi:hypothetical protein